MASIKEFGKLKCHNQDLETWHFEQQLIITDQTLKLLKTLMNS
jgi:hypothetical protein